MMITHFTPRAHWEEMRESGSYRVPSLDAQGFIHCSTPEQVIPVANFIAKDWDDVVLLWIDEEKVTSPIVYENLEGGDKLFPHIYGPLNHDAVVKVSDFLRDEYGEYIVPAH
jgi:uncharacterized protein (DUF952 family)